MRKNQKGFTLVELLVVVVILGILATLAVQTLGDRTKDAEIAKAKADLRTVLSAIELYKLDNAGDNPPNSTVSGETTQPDNTFVGTYIKNWPEHLTYSASTSPMLSSSYKHKDGSTNITDSNYEQDIE